MNLATTYLGLKLRTPLVPSASPLTKDADNIKRMEDAGAAAIVFHSLFEEQIRAGDSADSELAGFKIGLDAYVERIALAKREVNIPIIASLNGATFGGWTSFSRHIEQAGADAIELNLYSIPSDSDASAEDIEQGHLSIVATVKAQVKIPVAVKLGPYFTNVAHFARRLDRFGADGLVLFNRFCQPDIALETLTVVPDLRLSTPEEMRLPLHWIAILHGRVGCSLAATTGIHRGTDALKLIMAGADVTMLCSALLTHGIGHLRVVEQEMRDWMDQHGRESVGQLKGTLSQQHCPDPAAFDRALYVQGLAAYATTAH